MNNLSSPIFDVEINGENISKYISSFRYEDDMKKDNLLTLTINPDDALEFLDRDYITINTDIVFQFGYLSKELSSKHTAKIQDIITRYNSNGINVTLVCLDAGHVIKKNSDNVIYKSKTSSQIVSEISDKYSFNKEIDETSIVWDNMPQGNLSDFEFIDMLSEKEDDYLFFIRNETLFFKKRGLEKNSVLTFTYGDSDDVISFTPKQKLSNNSGVSSETLVTTINNSDGSQLKNTVNVENTKNKTILNSEIVSFDSKDNVLSKVASTAVRNKTIVKTTDNEEESSNIANNLVKSERLKSNEADLTVIGNPLLVPSEIITMAGVSRRHSGNYQITNVTHVINGSGYTSTCLIHTNGTNSGGNVGTQQPESETNKTVGDDKKDNTVVIRQFNSETNTIT